jgi:hypothetical protein
MAHGVKYTNSLTKPELLDIPPRSDLDLGDYLWEFIQDIDDSQLLDVLTAIVEELEQGRLLPKINKNNESSFASVCRDILKVASQQTASDSILQKQMISSAFDYWMENSMEIYTSIGLNKLRLDYTHILLNQNLCNWQDIQPFLEYESVDEQIQNLEKLQKIVEVVFFLKTNILCIPFETIRTVIKQVSALLLTHDFDLNRDIYMDIELPRYSASTIKLVDSITAQYRYLTQL